MIPNPNYTQTPNIFFDSIMKTLNESELKVFLAIVRKTFGWSKTRDRISLSQIMTLTGLSRQGVLNGLHGREGNNGIIGKGLILVFESSAGNEYEIHVSDSEVVHNVDQSKNQVVNEVDRSGQRSRPEVVHNVDLQKNSSKETIQKKVTKHQYGSFKNVLLTDEEHDKLKAQFPDLPNRIEKMSLYVESRGTKYKSHYAALLNWARNEQERAPTVSHADDSNFIDPKKQDRRSTPYIMYVMEHPEFDPEIYEEYRPNRRSNAG